MSRLAAAALFASITGVSGCAVVPPQAWSFDPHRPPAKEMLPVADVAALTQRLAHLQIERNEVRSRIAAEPDAWRRQALYAELHQVGMQLSPLERRLPAVASAR